MTKREKAQRISEILDRLFPAVEVPLQHQDPFTLLVAVVLSAQTTDRLVNEVTPALFARASTPAALAALPAEEVKRLIRRIGLSETKAKNLQRLSAILEAEHGGQVPRTLQALEALPGVGHKTASVVLNQAFGLAAFAVDTHIHRLAARWGLSSGKSVEQTERDLKRVFPEETWGKVHLQIIYFGRQYCPALYHDLDACPICSWAASKKRKEEERRRNAGLRRRGAAV
ncbi:MAG TPA: endonuclease III [Thermoanaerobaculia bacterium]|jgi:endonuclease-3|nr:endonuclease III [Thermoanaerobaculia bacterium]